MLSDQEILASGLLHRSLEKAPQTVVKAEGLYLYMQDGKPVLDACGGAAVVSVGHGNKEVIELVKNQLCTVPYVSASGYTTPVAEEFSNSLLKNYKDRVSKVYFCNSGSEANEGAIELALQYFFEQGKTSKTHFISRDISYHGNCLGSLSLSGFIARRRPFEQLLNSENFHKVSPANEYRFKSESETTQDYVDRLAYEFEQKVLETGPDNVAAFVAETVVGAAAGCVTAPEGYFIKIKQICDKYDILLILDEIMCGSGRTGTFFSWEQEGVVPDITTCGKAIASGYSPLSAIFFTEKIFNVLKNGSSNFNSRHTFQSYPLSCAAGLAVKRIVDREALLENVKEMGIYLKEQLLDKLSACKCVGDIRGRGLFIGIELVENKSTKQPFSPEEHVDLQIQEAIWQKRVAVYLGMAQPMEFLEIMY